MDLKQSGAVPSDLIRCTFYKSNKFGHIFEVRFEPKKD
jgi:hypothetical protein